MSLVSSHRTVFAAPASPVVSRVANRQKIHQRHRLAGEILAREFHGGVEEIQKSPAALSQVQLYSPAQRSFGSYSRRARELVDNGRLSWIW